MVALVLFSRKMKLTLIKRIVLIVRMKHLVMVRTPMTVTQMINLKRGNSVHVNGKTV